jgi:hypothetical protein
MFLVIYISMFINLGKKTMTGSKFRRMEWKRKKALKEGKGKGTKKSNGEEDEDEESGHASDMFEDELPTIHQEEAVASSHMEIR